MPSRPDTRTREAFGELVDTLRDVGERYVGSQADPADERNVLEGYRFAAHLLSAGIDFYLEGDPERPQFTRMVSPTRKYLGDNPDAIYYFARIRGDRSYRVTGRKTGECYLSFTVHGRAADGKLGGSSEPVLADVNDRDLKLEADGSFELVLSAREHPGNWLKLPPGAASLITRHYFERRRGAAADLDVVPQLRIEPLEDPGPPAPLDDAELARRFRDLAAFVRSATLETPRPAQPPAFVSTRPNEVGQPTVFRSTGTAAWGAVDIAYSSGPFRLQPGEALVMEGRFPPCAFANVVLWNRHLQCFDYRHRQVSLNREQTAQGPDGSYRIVIADRDPGVPNWIDTEGHREGTIFWRFLLPEEPPERPRCRVVPVEEVAR